MYHFDNHIFPREDIPVKNKCTILSQKDYSTILYYINSHKCKIIVRRFDGYSSPDEKVIVNIDSSTYEVPLGTSFIETNTPLEPINLEYSQKIPKVIMQTAEQNTCMDDIG